MDDYIVSSSQDASEDSASAAFRFDWPLIPSVGSFADKAISSIEDSHIVDAGTKRSPLAAECLGITFSLTTPVAGFEIDAGLFIPEGRVNLAGFYVSTGPAYGLRGISIGVQKGYTDSLEGDAVTLSGGVEMVAGSRSFDLDSLKPIGYAYGPTLSAGPPAGLSVSILHTSAFQFGGLFRLSQQIGTQFDSFVGQPPLFGYDL